MTPVAPLTCLLLVLAAGLGAAAADTAAEGHAWLTGRVADYNAQRTRLSTPDLARRFVDDTVDLERFADRVLGDYVENSLDDVKEHLRSDDYMYYVAVARQRVLAALEDRVVADLESYLDGGGARRLVLADARFDDDTGTVVVGLDAPDGTPLTCHLRRRDDGSWRLVDLELDGRTVSQRYRSRYAETLEQKYSPAVLVSQLRGLDYIVLEDFSFGTPGKLPLGWHWRARDDDRRKPYRVRQQDGHYYVAAHDSGGSVMLGRLAHWNPRRYPIMTWCWRADALPPGGDERFGHTNDSAAGIYVVFHLNWIGLPRHIKYVWSSTLPVGTVGRRNRIARPYFVVVDSGAEELGHWRFARVDLEADYDRTYGGRPKDRTQGLGLLTDANSTDSQAEAYYADLRVWTRQALETGRVQDYCNCYRQLDLSVPANSMPASNVPANTVGAGADGVAPGSGIMP